MSKPQTLQQLRSTIRQTLDPLIPENASVVLLDFPHYSNVGDSAIWLGQIAYLTYRKCKIVYSADSTNFSPVTMKRVPLSSIILLQGGGNFGDLYPRHQRLRETVIREFPNRTIIQLPQSIHFPDVHALQQLKDTIMNHPDMHLMLRDTASLSFAKQHFPTATCQPCPDMALMLDISPLADRPKKTDITVLSRTDKEKSTEFDSYGHESALIVDWLNEPAPRMQWLYEWAHRRMSWGSSKIPFRVLATLATMAGNAMARERLERGLALLGSGHAIVTDRLHAMILGWLGGSRIAYVDNSYQKLTNFLETWIPAEPSIERFADFESAITHASRTGNTPDAAQTNVDI